MAKKQIVLNRTQMKTKKKKQQPTPVGKLLRALGSAGGATVGGYFGQPALGGAAGNQLAAMASKWLGFGDYKVSKNSILLKGSNGIPAMHSANQSIVVRHKEYVGQIKGSQGFAIRYALPINPGVGIVFPWLSNIAARFQEYKIKGMIFHYVPTSGHAVSSTNPALGSIMFQTTYRASDIAPASKMEMMNEYHATETVPSETCIHPIECDPKENPFSIHYVRTTTPPTGEPLMSYDLGKTFVAVAGQQADGYVLGDLWVTYEIELKKPLVQSNIVGGDYLKQTFNAPATWSVLFNSPSSSTGTLGVTFANNTFSIPPTASSTYQITLSFSGVTSLSAVGGDFTPTVDNGALLPMNASGSQLLLASGGNGGGWYLTMTFIVYVESPSSVCVVTMPSPSPLTGTLGSFYFVVVELQSRPFP